MISARSLLTALQKRITLPEDEPARNAQPEVDAPLRKNTKRLVRKGTGLTYNAWRDKP